MLLLQTFMMAVNLDGLGIGQDQTGPTDDGYIEISTTMEPQDPYCCAGPDEDTDSAYKKRPAPPSWASFSSALLSQMPCPSFPALLG